MLNKQQQFEDKYLMDNETASGLTPAWSKLEEYTDLYIFTTNSINRALKVGQALNKPIGARIGAGFTISVAKNSYNYSRIRQAVPETEVLCGSDNKSD